MKENNKKDPILKQKRIQKLANIFSCVAVTTLCASVLTFAVAVGCSVVNANEQEMFLEGIDFEYRKDKTLVELQQEVDSGKLSIAEYLKDSSSFEEENGKGVSNYLEKYGTQSEQQEWQELIDYQVDDYALSAAGIGVASTFALAVGSGIIATEAASLERKA